MKFHKKALATLLSIFTLSSIIFSNPITSFADPTIGEGGMDGNTASSGDTHYGNGKVPSQSEQSAAEKAQHMLAIYPESCGYRISIVDKAGNRKTNSVDIIQMLPKELWEGTSQYSAGWNQNKNLFGTTVSAKDKRESFFYSNGIKTEEYTEETWNNYGVPNAIVDGKTIETHIYRMDDFDNQLNAQYQDRINKLGNVEVKNNTPLKITPPIIWGDPVGAGGGELMKLFKSPLGDIGAENPDGKENVITVIVNMLATTNDNTGKQGTSVDYLFKFADPSEQSLIGQDKSKLASLQTSGSSGKTSSGGPGGSSNNSANNNSSGTDPIKQSDIIMMKEYKILVEPIFYDVISIDSRDATYTAVTNNYVEVVAYGTESYLSKYAYEKAKNQIGLSDEVLHRTSLGQHWREGFIGVETLQLAYDDNDLGIKTMENAGIAGPEIPGEHAFYSLAQLASGDNYKTVGYGVHIYDRLLQSSDSGTPTWDQITFPKDNYKPGPSPSNIIEGKPNGPEYPPEYPPEGDEYKITNKDHQFHIIKFYAEKQPDGSYKYLENHTRDNTVHTININDEPNYTVDNWYTSSTYTKPTNPTDDYDVWKTNKALKTTQEGVKSGRVTVKASDPDTTLYIRLVSTPMLTIIKVEMREL